jgi:hypothetical protein
MDLKITALAVILFFVLSPTVLVRLPSSGNKYVVAGTHALIFGILFHLVQTFTNVESFVEGIKGTCAKQKKDTDCTGYENCVWNSKIKKCRNICGDADSLFSKKQCQQSNSCSWDNGECKYNK